MPSASVESTNPDSENTQFIIIIVVTISIVVGVFLFIVVVLIACVVKRRSRQNGIKIK